MKRVVTAIVDFVAGDDIWVAVGVGAAVVLTGALARLPIDPWWLLPLAVPAIVAISLLRATRRQPHLPERRPGEPGAGDAERAEEPAGGLPE